MVAENTLSVARYELNKHFLNLQEVVVIINDNNKTNVM